MLLLVVWVAFSCVCVCVGVGGGDQEGRQLAGMVSATAWRLPWFCSHKHPA
jgi:hypothetical protein